MSDEISEEEIEHILQDGVSEGLFEVAEENDQPGNTRFKLTSYGEVEAQRTIASKGLPFLVMVSARKALEDGKQRTVKSMSDEIIRNFPNKLKRAARTNFAPFWGEYANFTPQQYLEAYQEAQS